MDRSFVDEVHLTVRGGRGGDGCTSFRRQPHQPHGGPDGGNGGSGGDVILKATRRRETLAHLQNESSVVGGDGDTGGPNDRNGATGESVTIKVPPGTVAYNADTGDRLADLTEDGQEVTLAEGGPGGRGNRCFANSQRQLPRFHERGLPGERVNLRLEVKLLAEVGLVGLPNAGKSTLLATLTNARPEVADHPFTTTQPNLGVLEHDHSRATICDVPGLIEDAHQGAGLGLQFLKHADRTHLLLHVIDLNRPDPVQDYRVIREEIKAYSGSMADKPTLVILNKTDLVDDDLITLVREELPVEDNYVFLVSCLQETGLEPLREEILDRAQEADHQADGRDTPQERVVEMEREQPITVYQHGDSYVLRGDRVEELLKRFDLTNQEALGYVRNRLLEMGLHKKLEAKGCRPGDTVRVGGREFEYTG